MPKRKKKHEPEMLIVSFCDIVTIATPTLGALINRVKHCGDIAPWTFGTGALMTNLAKRGLLKA